MGEGNGVGIIGEGRGHRSFGRERGEDKFGEGGGGSSRVLPEDPPVFSLLSLTETFL